MKHPYKYIILLLIFLITSCAAGHKIKYHDTVASLSASGNITIAVATHDQRQYILSGESDPDYVGLNRAGGSLVPFKPQSVTTESSKSLAEDMTASICNSLAAKGFRTIPVNTAPRENSDKILARMKDAKGDRLLLLTLYEWQSDTYLDTGLYYNLKLEIFDISGNKFTEKVLKGEDNLPRAESLWSPGLSIEGMKKVIPKVFKDKIEALLNDKSVLETLCSSCAPRS
jgi:hypothetical protein